MALFLAMGAVLTCCPWRKLCSQYEPLSETHERTIGAEEARIQAIADIDEALLRDPEIQAVLNGEDADGTLDNEELDAMLKAIGS
jgi:hypothetical protein